MLGSAGVGISAIAATFAVTVASFFGAVEVFFLEDRFAELRVLVGIAAVESRNWRN